MTPLQVLLTIAGYDPSNGAGVTADLMTFAAHGYFGTSAITALTVQSTLGVFGVRAVEADYLRATLQCLLEDLPPVGVKIGMINHVEGILLVTDYLNRFHELHRGNSFIPIVLDPIVRSSSGAELAGKLAVEAMRNELLEKVDWICPNREELAVLTETTVASRDDVLAGADLLGTRYPKLNVVVTGGDHDPPTDFVRLASGESFWVEGVRIDSRSTHGTGCAFSSALLCQLVAGKSAREAVFSAKEFVRRAILMAPGVGHGRGPMQVLWPLLDKAKS